MNGTRYANLFMHYRPQDHERLWPFEFTAKNEIVVRGPDVEKRVPLIGTPYEIKH